MHRTFKKDDIMSTTKDVYEEWNNTRGNEKGNCGTEGRPKPQRRAQRDERKNKWGFRGCRCHGHI